MVGPHHKHGLARSRGSVSASERQARVVGLLPPAARKFDIDMAPFNLAQVSFRDSARQRPNLPRGDSLSAPDAILSTNISVHVCAGGRAQAGSP